MEVKKSRKKLLLIIAVVVLLLIAAVAGGFVIYKSLNHKEYQKQSELGDKYYSSMQYSLAIVAYQEAIKVDSTQVDAYKNLAKIYIQQEQYTEAKTLLRKGFALTKSQSLRDLIDEVDSLQYGDGGDQNMTMQALEEKSKEVKPNSEIFKNVAGATHEQLQEEYKSFDAEKEGANEWKVTYSGFNGTVFYKNDGKSKKGPANGQQPERVEFANLGDMFSGFQGVVSYSRLVELFGAKIEMVEDDILHTNVIQIYYKNCKMVIEADESGNILSPTAANYVTSTIIIENEDTCTISGKVRDYSTMNGIKAKITYTCTDKDSNLDPVVVTSETSGKYSVDLPVGNYTVKIEADRYEDGEFELKIPELEDQEDVFYDIEPKEAKPVGTVTLEWDDPGVDLDLFVHASVYGAAYYGDMEITDDNDKMVAKLNQDVRDGNGIETVTLYDSELAYSVCVQEYTQSVSIKNTKARITVALDGQAPVTMDVPSTGRDCYHWCVCTLGMGRVGDYGIGGLSTYDEARTGLYKEKD